MRKFLLAIGVVGLIGLGAPLAFWFFSPPAQAESREALALQKGATAEQLPISQIVLFSSGVGYFQREGTVEGNARVDLSFPVQDINDLLKSMVVRDLDGGAVSTISYDSNAPVEKTLKSYAINLNGDPSFGAILNQARGEKVEVVLQQTNATQPGTVTGTVLGIEAQHQAAGKDTTVNVELLNLWCSDGMRSLKLSEVQRVRFLNPIMDTEVKRALETLAQSHDTQKKSVSINFLGEGKRKVKVGYVVENPIWKTSYRLVLPKEKGEQPALQGWAIVENTTDEDWKDCRMALVSGRPISFKMDLYTPLYVPRPVVEPELFASLRPVAYSGDLNDDPPRKKLQDGRGGRAATDLQKQQLDRDMKEPNDESIDAALIPRPSKPSSYTATTREQLERRLNLDAGVRSAATAAKLGDSFQYVLDKPVSLPRQKSALLPIIRKDIAGVRVSIYNEQTQAKFPLLGLRLKNTLDLHLMQGPLTVFEGSNYAGDARILDVEPKEEFLLSYAIDLGTEVNPVPSVNNGRYTVVKVYKGILQTTSKLHEAKTYLITNHNDTERTVLIEHPVRNDYRLVDGIKPVEMTRDTYRFEVKVPADKAASLVVTEERQLSEAIQLTNLNDDRIRFILNNPVTGDKVKAGLQKVVQLRAEMAKTQRDIAEQQRQLQTIAEDQVRLRANLKEMPPTAAAYKRYLEKFDAQETQIEQYQAEIKKLQGTEFGQKKELEDYLANFSAE